MDDVTEKSAGINPAPPENVQRPTKPGGSCPVLLDLGYIYVSKEMICRVGLSKLEEMNNGS